MNTGLPAPLSAATPSNMSRTHWSFFVQSDPSSPQMASSSSKSPTHDPLLTTYVVMSCGTSTFIFLRKQICSSSCGKRALRSLVATLGQNAPISTFSSGPGQLKYPKTALTLLQQHKPQRFNSAGNSRFAGRASHPACKPTQQAGRAPFICSVPLTRRQTSSTSPGLKARSTPSSMTTW